MVSTIKVCMGSSCFARGNSKNLQLIQKFISERNLDAEIELTGLRCCDKCSKGPNITIRTAINAFGAARSKPSKLKTVRP